MAFQYDLSKKTALVTGAGRGIGLATAKALAACGAEVTLMARTEKEISQAAIDIKASGGKANYQVLDVSDIAAVRSYISGCEPFNILINNAGTNRPAPATNVTLEDFDAIMNLNVRSAFFMAQAVAQRLIETGQTGSIVNVSSQMAHVGSPGRSVYCASKHAMEGFTKAMAIEWGANNIRVNTVCPTFIKTPLTEPFLEDPEFSRLVLGKIVLGRVGEVEEVANAILFLSSDASSLMTGSALKVDGGWTAE